MLCFYMLSDVYGAMCISVHSPAFFLHKGYRISLARVQFQDGTYSVGKRLRSRKKSFPVVVGKDFYDLCHLSLYF